MVVTKADLERHIARVRDEITDPRVGIYGPDSVSWRINKEAALFLGGGKAALLQLAHPFVAHAVDQHSQTKTDPLGRFQRTFDNVFAMVFGDWASAERRARRVHAIHSRIKGEISEDVGAFQQGSHYEANQEQALLWVHATLLDTALEVYQLVKGPLSAGEKSGYYEESKRFARLFGIPDGVLPEDHAAFERYYRDMLASDVITVGAPAREIASFLFKSPRPAFDPLFAWLRTLTAGLMPPRLRADFGLPWEPAHRIVYHGSISTLRRTYGFIPRRLRYVPAYVRAQRRLHGVEGPDRVGNFLERLATAPLNVRHRG